MSSLGSPNPFFIAGKKAYEIKRSLRFNDDDSAYLTRTPSSAGNRKIWTLSVWVKRTTVDANQRIFTAYDGSNNNAECNIQFQSDGKIQINNNNTSSNTDTNLKTDRLFRDPSSWYHIVVATDMTQGTAANRVNLYVNGVQETSFSTESYGTQNVDWWFNNNSPQTIGRRPTSERYFDGYMAEFNFIDGSQLTPASFGATDAITGQWNPKKYIGSYGTNGFYLNFSDNSGTTATTLGKDSSGNGNNFTPNNLSVDAGESNDSLEDTPTNNFPTINPLDGGTNGLLSNGNTRFKPNSSNGGNFNVFYSNFAMRSGKWYFEVLIGNTNSGTNSIQFGVGSYKYERDSTNQNGYPGTSGLTFLNVNNSSSDYRIGVVDGSQVGSSVSTASTNDIYGIAFDADNKKVYFYKNGSAEGESSGYNVTDVGSGDFFFFSTLRYSTGVSYDGGDPTLAINFGQRAFSYTPPTGYKKLNSANLPNPTILLPNKHFDILLWTGDGNDNRDITGLNFQPDWVWIKERSSTSAHVLTDSVRGIPAVLESNNTANEDTSSGAADIVQAFNSNGFQVGTSGRANQSGQTNVGWNWNAGDTDGKTYAVTVVSDSGNKYRFDGFGTSAVTLDLAEGGTYIFDQSDSSNAGHPLRFYTAADKTGGEYTTGVTTAGTPGQSGAYTQIVVAASAPTLFYQCSVHAGMGGQANTNSTLGSSNFDGTLQSTVKVNATAGFSIVSWTSTGTTGSTIGHGLGVKPEWIILKSRDTSSSQPWRIYSSYLGATQSVMLDSTSAASAQTGVWNDTEPTSSVFTVGSFGSVNENTKKYVAFCFSSVAGFSKAGFYTGNGSTDGAYVFCGFRPSFVLIKSTTGSKHWVINDSARNPHNVANKTFLANATNSEDSGSSFQIDILSNGFKCRTDGVHVNTNGGAHIFLAFAESPFKNARAR